LKTQDKLAKAPARFLAQVAFQLHN
jgi:hypothetical protein